MNKLIDLLKHKQLLWHANDSHDLEQNLISTGYPLLDEKLAGGFPATGVIELLSPPGVGELRLLMPLLASSEPEQLLVFINPPGLINASSLQFSGIDERRLLCVYPQQAQQALWTAEQCLKSGCCADVILWFELPMEVHHIKRLQLASHSGGSRQFLLRQQKSDVTALPVDLSMSLAAHPQGLKVSINKRKKGWPLEPFILPLGSHWPWLVCLPDSDNIIMFPDIRDVS